MVPTREGCAYSSNKDWRQFVLMIWLSNKIGKRVIEECSSCNRSGTVTVYTELNAFIGKTGKTTTVLRPSGKIEIDNAQFDAVSESGFIEKKEQM